MSEKNGHEKTAAERYRELTANRPKEFVTLTLPSGFEIEMEKPGIFATLFSSKDMPQMMASQAAVQWQKEGLFDIDDLSEDQQKTLERQIEYADTVSDKVVALSHSPKLVFHKPKGRDEMRVTDLTNDDLAYLFAWVAGGGKESAMLSRFSDGLGKNPANQPNGKKRRRKTKRVSKN